MDYLEFQRQLGKAGLTVKAFAELMRMNPTSFSNLSKKPLVPDHWAIIAALMGEMKDHGLDFSAVIARLSICPKKPRGSGKGTKFGGDKQYVLSIESAPKGPSKKGTRSR